jgi:hypothetical protein
MFHVVPIKYGIVAANFPDTNLKGGFTDGLHRWALSSRT